MDTKRLRQRVLDLAIHGKLVPQNPQDEPASKLLKRIAEEKERLVIEGKIKKSKKKDSEDTDEVPFEVPQGWVWSKLEDISNSIGDGLHGTPIFDENGDYFFVNGNNLNKKIIIKDDTKRTTYEEYQKQGLTFNKQTVFLSINGTLGNTAFYNEEKIVLGKSTCYINLCDNVSKYYIDNLLKSNYFAKYSVSSATGSTIKNIPLSAVRNFTLPLPPLAEQHRIVSEVEKYFSLIDILEESENDLQQSIQKAKSKILDLAIKGKLVEKTDEWEELSGKNVFYPLKSTKPSGEIFKYIDIDSIDNKSCRIISPKLIKTSNAPSRATRYTQKGDVLFSIVRPYLKNIALIEEDNCIASTGFYVCHSEKMIPKYCYYLMISDYVVQGLNLYMKGDNSPSISIKDIQNFIFPVPPLEEQHRIVAKIEELFTQLDNIAEALK